MKRSLDALRRAVVAVLLAPIRLYQRVISPALPARCKYYPTCSDYALHAVREVGPVRGTLLAAWRLARCNPWSHGGYDPIEARPFFRGDDTPLETSRVPAGQPSTAAGPSRAGTARERHPTPGAPA